MALKLNERYPGRMNNPTAEYPQGSFKNRTAPGVQDGSYLEKDWANDALGFLSRLLAQAEITANGNVDTALSSQYYDALMKLVLSRKNPFADIKSDGPAAVAEALDNLGLGDLQSALKYGAPLIGELVMWSRPEMPQEWWPDMKMEFIPYMGQSFDPVKYPILASMHPNATLSADMRGMFPRGWDNTRGIDPGRPIMNEQGDAMRKLTGIMNNTAGSGLIRPDGMLTGVFKRNSPTVSGTPAGGTITGSADPVFDNELVTPVAAENRPKNIAWNMIVRAK